MCEAFINREFSPGLSLNFRFGLAASIVRCDLEQAIGCVITTIQDDILDPLSQSLVQIIVDREHASIDDAHVHASLNGVKQKYAVHGFADGIVTPKTKRHVTQAARNSCTWAGGLDF